MKIDIQIPYTELARCECFVADKPTTAQAVQAQTGADLVINASIFNLRSGKILSRIVADGRVYGTKAAPAWGIGFPDGGAPVRTWDNGIGCQHYLGPYSYAVVDGEIRDGLNDSARRGRMLVGLTADSLVVLGFDDADPSACSTGTACRGMLGRGCVFAVNLDGGASVQWAGSGREAAAGTCAPRSTDDQLSAPLADSLPVRGCSGGRKVPAFLCIYLKKTESGGNTLRAIATKRQPVYTAAGVEEQNRYIDKNDLCTLGQITQNLLIPVTYPTPSGPRDAFVRSLEGFIQG